MTDDCPPRVMNPGPGENFLRMDLVEGKIFELVCFSTPLTPIKMMLIGQEIAKAHGLRIIPELEIAVKDQLSIGKLPGFSCRLEPPGADHQELVMQYGGIPVVIDRKIPLTELHIRTHEGDVLGRLIELAPPIVM